MDEKKTIKISLSTFFLILAIIVICIISCLLIKFYNEKSQLETETVSLKNQNENLANIVKKEETNTEILSKSATETTANANITVKTYSYEDVKGLYSFTKEIQSDIEGWYNLYLYENGTFKYEYGIEHPNSIIGNYIIADNTLVLNKMFIGGGDVGLRTTSGEIKLEINTDGTITDKNNLLDENIKAGEFNVDLSNITLNKSSAQKEQEYLNYSPSIMTHINNSLANNAVTGN